MARARMVLAAAGGLLGCLVASCAPAAGPVWQQVALPSGARPSSLAVAGEALVVGGGLPGGSQPLLSLLDPAARLTPVPLQPTQNYARAADLVALSPAEDELLALGVARGGAHGNQRWTSWQGPLAGPVRDHDQDFNTFGGHAAGPLLGIVRPGGRPVVVGSRAGSAGFDAALWTLHGTTWTRQPTDDPALVSSPDRVLVFRAAASVGDTVVIAGAETGLAGAVRQAAMVWAGPVAGPWVAIPLAVPEELVSATGLAQATSLACGENPVCWAAGWVRGSPVAWQLDLAAGSSRAFLLDGEGGSPTDPLAVVTLVAGTPVVFTNADRPLVAWRCGDGWESVTAPPGRSVAAAAMGTGLYVVAGDEGSSALWKGVLDTSAC